jgi:hypothetical protein
VCINYYLGMHNKELKKNYWRNIILDDIGSCIVFFKIKSNIEINDCEIIINLGVLIFADFVVHLNHENKNSSKNNFPIDCYLYWLKPRILQSWKKDNIWLSNEWIRWILNRMSNLPCLGRKAIVGFLFQFDNI